MPQAKLCNIRLAIKEKWNKIVHSTLSVKLAQTSYNGVHVHAKADDCAK